MKYIFTFLFGAACGVGGTLLWLRKDIKQALNAAREQTQAQGQSEKEEELPFVMGKGEEQENAKPANMPNVRALTNEEHEALQKQRTEYNKVVGQYSTAVTKDSFAAVTVSPVGVPIPPREEGVEVVEIDKDEFRYNKEYQKDFLVWFAGDRIMSTENGTVIEAPAMLVGSGWETLIGMYAPGTAFVRNERLGTDYEIKVEEETYLEEFGSPDDMRED